MSKPLENFSIVTRPFLLLRCRGCGHRGRATDEMLRFAGLRVTDDIERISAKLYCGKCRRKDFEITRGDRYALRRFLDRH